MRRLTILAVACCCILVGSLPAQECHGVERWAVKVGADPDAGLVDLQHPVVTSIHDLLALARPQGVTADPFIRTPLERTVRIVDGRLMQFKRETGKTGDMDFHLVISDETQLFTPGGQGTTPIPHSFIAEIVDPACIGGRNGFVTAPSLFVAQLSAVFNKFLAQFPNVHGDWNDGGGIPVRLTGIGFFDRDHNQTGRTARGFELHPLLDIEFNPGPLPPPLAPTVVATATPLAIDNPGFENGGQGWRATAGVITSASGEPAHAGTGKAWLGGYGETHSDTLSLRVALPSAHAISVTFFLHIGTEDQTQTAHDRLRVRVRAANGQLLRTLEIFTNLEATPGYVRHSYDLSAWRGRTIRLSLEATENNSAVTSFVVDDFAIIVEP